MIIKNSCKSRLDEYMIEAMIKNAQAPAANQRDHRFEDVIKMMIDIINDTAPAQEGSISTLAKKSAKKIHDYLDTRSLEETARTTGIYLDDIKNIINFWTSRKVDSSNIENRVNRMAQAFQAEISSGAMTSFSGVELARGKKAPVNTFKETQGPITNPIKPA
jgi:flagellar hook-basal body complex protein FliE